jgi:hypothetical protein
MSWALWHLQCYFFAPNTSNFLDMRTEYSKTRAPQHIHVILAPTPPNFWGEGQVWAKQAPRCIHVISTPTPPNFWGEGQISGRELKTSPSAHSCYYNANSPKLLRRGANKYKWAGNKPPLMLFRRVWEKQAPRCVHVILAPTPPNFWGEGQISRGEPKTSPSAYSCYYGDVDARYSIYLIVN